MNVKKTTSTRTLGVQFARADGTIIAATATITEALHINPLSGRPIGKTIERIAIRLPNGEGAGRDAPGSDRFTSDTTGEPLKLLTPLPT